MEITPLQRLLCPLLLTLTFCASAAAAEATPENPRLISVTGEAERRVAPDVALLTVEVLTEGKDPARARAEADKITLEAVRTLRSGGIDDDDIDSTSLSIDPQYRWIKEQQKQELIGYRISRQINARLLDLEQLGVLLEALSEGGVNRVHPPRLGIADDEQVHQDVMAAAASNAAARAAVIAQALGVSLGEVQNLHVMGQSRPVPMAQGRMMAMAESASADTAGESYQAGNLTFRATVSASFAIK